jgi:hypothetical protein
MTRLNVLTVLSLAVLCLQYPSFGEDQSANKNNLINNDPDGWVCDCVFSLLLFLRLFSSDRSPK